MPYNIIYKYVDNVNLHLAGCQGLVEEDELVVG